MKIKVDPSIRSEAVFSLCGRYRYRLTRTRDRDLVDDDDVGNTVNFLMCNPSIADEGHNDPTIERCMKRAFKYGILGRRYITLVITNLFAVISTDPKHLTKLDDPIGPENDKAIMESALSADIVICGWGDPANLGRVLLG